MSDEPGPSTLSRSTEDGSRSTTNNHGTLPSAELRKRVRALFNRKRVELLDDLCRDLDILVYAELSIIYYMDCFLIRFALRAIVQFTFFTPKPAAFPGPPKPEPYVGAILGTNLMCLVLHIFGAAPAAGEATRYYLHGGLALDFIGQRGPSSKIVLVLLDLFVVTLQLIHLSAHIARKRLRDGNVSLAVAELSSAQDIESEERGVRRSAELEQRDMQDSIQLQTLNGAGRVQHATEQSDHENEHSETLQSTAPRLDAFLLESFWNGQIVLADLNPLKTVREQIVRYQQTPIETRRNAHYAQLAARMSEIRYLTRRR